MTTAVASAAADGDERLRTAQRAAVAVASLLALVGVGSGIATPLAAHDVADRLVDAATLLAGGALVVELFRPRRAR